MGRPTRAASLRERDTYSSSSRGPLGRANASYTKPKPPWRRNLCQLVVVSLMTAVVGATLQLNKLSVLDGAGREFGMEGYVGKTSFLVPYALCKAVCNLLVGGLADTHGRKPIALFGSLVGLVGPAVVLLFCGVAFPHDQTKAWPFFVGSSAFLGISQGITWTSTILITIDLCGPQSRGLASGLSETVGYTFIAIFAEVYGALERSTIECGWYGGTVSENGSSVQIPSNVCRVASGSVCVTPDDFVSECAGQCVCHGYAVAPFALQLALAGVGVAVCAGFLHESNPHEFWFKGLVRANSHRGVPQLAVDSYSGGASQPSVDPVGTSHSGEIALVSISTCGEHTPAAATRGGSMRSGSSRGGSTRGEFVALEALEADETLLDGGGGDGDGRDVRHDETSGEGDAEPSGDTADPPCTPLTFWQVFHRTTWGNRNLAAVSLAGFCANFETGMAWGLLASWSRDGLGFSGARRDLFMAAYSFTKGGSQLFSGVLSDKIGRRVPITVGLLGGAFSLYLAAFGAGYDGRYVLGGDASDGDKTDGLKFTNLLIAGVALGSFTGLMYPVLGAAAADHAPSKKEIALTLGVTRFWRDLGYAMGMPISLLADFTSPEAALICVGGAMTVAGGVFANSYREAP